MTNNRNAKRVLGLLTLCAIGAAAEGPVSSVADWELHTDQSLGVQFRCPKEWKPNAAYQDRTYLDGKDGSVQLMASGGEDPLEECRSSVSHHLKPYGEHPSIRAIKVDGRKACLVLPSKEYTNPLADAQVVAQFPQPVKLDGDSYGQLILIADKTHIIDIARTVRFISPVSQNSSKTVPVN